MEPDPVFTGKPLNECVLHCSFWRRDDLFLATFFSSSQLRILLSPITGGKVEDPAPLFCKEIAIGTHFLPSVLGHQPDFAADTNLFSSSGKQTAGQKQCFFNPRPFMRLSIHDVGEIATIVLPKKTSNGPTPISSKVEKRTVSRRVDGAREARISPVLYELFRTLLSRIRGSCKRGFFLSNGDRTSRQLSVEHESKGGSHYCFFTDSSARKNLRATSFYSTP